MIITSVIWICYLIKYFLSLVFLMLRTKKWETLEKCKRFSIPVLHITSIFLFSLHPLSRIPKHVKTFNVSIPNYSLYILNNWNSDDIYQIFTFLKMILKIWARIQMRHWGLWAGTQLWLITFIFYFDLNSEISLFRAIYCIL